MIRSAFFVVRAQPSALLSERDDFWSHQEQGRSSHVVHRCFHTPPNIKLIKREKNLRAYGSLSAVFPGESSRVDVCASLNQKENHWQVRVAAASGMDSQHTIENRVNRLSIVEGELDQAYTKENRLEQGST